MKRMRKIALPLAVFVLGIGSAYATTAEKETAKTIEFGYRFNPLAPPGMKCNVTTTPCSTIPSGDICTYMEGSQEHNLFKEGCLSVLFRVP
ncbi:DUF6520 family protein [Chryseobacterium sediminis]|jgi:hypothetical protein|uniref:DUF6520 family protein n=1 Tax=Chryseobacterium sediminis TaxID=1679494 RepID=UPI00286674D6|nr:DUF6520 family protein [Chryseobacterium sediminis]MDR6461619.1 hypothetical protein [Chryseobacterium sediminis]